MARYHLPIAPAASQEERNEPFLCLSDFVRPLSSGITDVVGAFASSIDADMEGLYEKDPISIFLVQTLSDRLAEAATEKMRRPQKKPGDMPRMKIFPYPIFLSEKYQGIRPAVGYLSARPIRELHPGRDSRYETNRYPPDREWCHVSSASVCGLMFAHPASQYFSVGKIGEDQLADYAGRRGKTVERMRKFLATNLQ